MKTYLYLLVVMAGTISCTADAKAQVTGLRRGVSAHLAYFEGTETVGGLTDSDYAGGFGSAEYRAEVTTDSSSCYAMQSSTATVSGDSAVISGLLAIGSSQAVPGIACLFHIWASVTVSLNVESSAECRISGVLSENAHVIYQLHNMVTWEYASVEVPSIPGEFEQAMTIAQSGPYELSVFLHDIYSTQEIGSRGTFAEINLVAVVPVGVPTESVSWSRVKALWK
ncbi:MAG: hypothetical protein IH621_04615 [Krumholzibacteria bacterium]|nr:hypothetical protein [Candidatus Krumholzibacteria bacterium]